jgi:hypothetical protein
MIKSMSVIETDYSGIQFESGLPQAANTVRRTA